MAYKSRRGRSSKQVARRGKRRRLGHVVDRNESWKRSVKLAGRGYQRETGREAWPALTVNIEAGESCVSSSFSFSLFHFSVSLHEYFHLSSSYIIHSFNHPFICLFRPSSSRFFALFFKSSSPLRHLLFFHFLLISHSLSPLFRFFFFSTFDFTFPLHIFYLFLTIFRFFLPPSSFPLPSLLLSSNLPIQPYSLLITPLTPYDLRERFCPLSVSSPDQPATASFPLQLTPNTTSRAERPEGVAARSSIASATVVLQASCFFLSTPPGDRVLRTISNLSNRVTAKTRMKISCSILIIKIRRIVELLYKL